MPHCSFSDETNTHGPARYYGIGTVALDEADAADAAADLDARLQRGGVNRELKWSDVRDSPGLALAVIDAFTELLRGGAFFHALVADKRLFHNWKSLGEEEAFYQTYVFHLEHLAHATKDTLRVRIDDRSDSYAKQDEKLQIILNHMLAQLQSEAVVADVEKVDSKEFRLVQLADIWAGAVTFSTQEAHGGDRRLLDAQPSKREIVEGLAGQLGWDSLCYDTLPPREVDSVNVNIWHWPLETRGKPCGSRRAEGPVSGPLSGKA